MKRWESSNNRGFTIVELLIVIVVIGILAAITIVAFNGVQSRAENNKTISAVGQYAKILQQYSVNNSAYPIANWACLAPHTTPTATRCGNMTDSVNACGGGGASTQSAFDTTIKTVATTLPVLSTQQMTCGGKEYSGAWYHSTDGSNAIIQFYLKGNVNPCPSIGSLRLIARSQNDNTTWCNTALPAL